MQTSYSFKVLYQEIKQYKKELFIANIVALIAVIINTPVPLLMPMLVDEILLKKPAFLVHMVNSIVGHEVSSAYVFILFVLMADIVTGKQIGRAHV